MPGGSPGWALGGLESEGSCGRHQPGGEAGGEQSRGEAPQGGQRKAGARWQEEAGREKRGAGRGRAPQPLTLAGAGSPSVIAGSKDTAGKAKGAREVSCSRSRWPKSACHGEQGRGHWSQTSTPGRQPSPAHPEARRGEPRLSGAAQACSPAWSGPLAERAGPASQLPQECPAGKALPPSPGRGWGHVCCHWGSCTLM